MYSSSAGGEMITVASVQASDGYRHRQRRGGRRCALLSMRPATLTMSAHGRQQDLHAKGQLTFPVADTLRPDRRRDFEHPGQTTPPPATCPSSWPRTISTSDPQHHRHPEKQPDHRDLPRLPALIASRSSGRVAPFALLSPRPFENFPGKFSKNLFPQPRYSIQADCCRRDGRWQCPGVK